MQTVILISPPESQPGQENFCKSLNNMLSFAVIPTTTDALGLKKFGASIIGTYLIIFRKIEWKMDLAMDGTTPSSRKRDSERTKDNILEVAASEFADLGFNGARMDAIAARTHTAKRMIYYYFNSKEELYLKVLDRAYGGIRTLETELQLDHLEPEVALRKLIEFTFDYHDEHPNFVRLIMNENMLRGVHLTSVLNLRARNNPAITVLSAVLERGRKAGVFHVRNDVVDIHMMISAICFYRVSNKYTFGTSFGCDMADPVIKSRQREMVVSTVISYLKSP